MRTEARASVRRCDKYGCRRVAGVTQTLRGEAYEAALCEECKVPRNHPTFVSETKIEASS